MAATATAERVQSQDVCHMNAGAQALGPSFAAGTHGRELDQKYSNWDSNQLPYEMLAVQVLALPALPQPQLLD